MSNLRKAWNLFKLMNSQWWTYERLKKLQEKKLRAIVKHAYDNIPLYHEKFKKAGIRPEEIKTIPDLIKVPFLTKEEIKKNYPERIVASSVDITNCWTPHTGGSTGMPVTVVYDEHAEDFEKAVALRPNLSCGQGIFDKWIVITSQDNIVLKEGHRKWFQRFGLFSQECISLFDNVEKQISILEKLDPDILDGYSSSIYLLAKEIKESGNEKVRPRIVYGTSEMLTKKMREVIDSAFNVRMYDQFGSVEMGRTAWECPEHVGYHLDMEATIMEFLKDGEQVAMGERGEIVYTNLYNYGMPFIRYRIGDFGIPTDERCPCGRGLPLMEIIEGRKDSFMKLPSGKIVAPTVWIVVLMHYDLEHYKVIQEKIDQIKIQIVPGQNFNIESINKIKKDAIDALKEDMTISIEVVDEIPREKSGKIKPIVSKLKMDW